MDTGLLRIYKLLTFLAETVPESDTDYVGILASAIPEWSNSLRVLGIHVSVEELCSQPFMKARIDPTKRLEVYYGVDFDEAAEWFHTAGIISKGQLELLRLERTMYLLGEPPCP